MQPCWQVFPKEKDSSFTTKVGPNKLGKKVGGPVYGACVIRIYTERSMVTRNEILAKKLSHLSASGEVFAPPFDPVDKLIIPSRQMSHFLSSYHFSDWKLRVGLKTYSVHRIVLANASKYFHGLFLSGFCSGASTINRETSFSTGNAANSSSLSTQVDGQYNAPASAEKGNIGLDEADDAIHDNDNDTNHPLYSISTKRKNNDVSSHTIDAGQQISTDGDRLTVLELPARTEAHFDAVLTYIYDGTVTLNPRNAIPLLVLADMLMIDDLQRSIKRYIQLTLLNNSHKPNHMCWFLKTACEYGGHGDLLDIQHRCLSWMAENLEKTFSVIPHLPPDLFSMILNGASFSSVKRRAIAHYLAHTLWSIPKKKLLELIHRAETKVSHSVLASSLRMCLLCTVDADEERGGTGDGEPNLPGLSMNLQVSPEASTVAKKSVTYDESMNFDRSSSSSIQDEQGQAEFFFSTLSSLTEYYNAKVPLEKLESILVSSTQHVAAISDQSFDGGDNTGAPADSKEVIRVQLDEADVFASTVNGVSMAVLLLMLHSDTLHVSCEDDVLNFVEAVVSVFLKSGFIMDQQQCTPQQQLFLSLMWSPVRWSFISSRKKVLMHRKYLSARNSQLHGLVAPSILSHSSHNDAKCVVDKNDDNDDIIRNVNSADSTDNHSNCNENKGYANSDSKSNNNESNGASTLLYFYHRRSQYLYQQLYTLAVAHRHRPRTSYLLKAVTGVDHNPALMLTNYEHRRPDGSKVQRSSSASSYSYSVKHCKDTMQKSDPFTPPFFSSTVSIPSPSTSSISPPTSPSSLSSSPPPTRMPPLSLWSDSDRPAQSHLSTATNTASSCSSSSSSSSLSSSSSSADEPVYRLSSTDVSQVKASYLEFFDHISVRSGWRKPVFTAEDVTDLFHIAAEVVVSVRLELDAVNNSLPVPERKLVIRQIDGSAQDFLWTVTQNPNPRPKPEVVEEGSLASIYMTFLGGMLDGDSDTDIKRDGKEQDGKGVGKVSPDSMNAECSAFVRNLVHHTFRDAYGYVEELTEAKVDEAIRKYYITAISNNQ